MRPTWAAVSTSDRLTTTGLEKAEVYRGPNSSLYGADAASGVVSLTTPRGTTSFPSFFLSGDGGNLYTHHEEAELAGAHNRLDYLGAFSWFQTANALPMDQYHNAAAVGNFGWQPTGATQIARHRPLQRGRHRRAQCVEFLSRHRPGNAEGPGPLHQRLIRRSDHGGLS